MLASGLTALALGALLLLLGAVFLSAARRDDERTLARGQYAFLSGIALAVLGGVTVFLTA